MNIFKIIENATSRIEPLHSRFLAEALKESLKADRTFFEKVWKLIAPSAWDVPKHPEILTEEVLSTGSIDIVIRTRERRERIVGIEIKTKEESATEGQLKRYRDGLDAKYPKSDLTMTYLTPFNKERAELEGGSGAAESLPTVREFSGFSESFPRARHVSWLDMADICWVDNLLWEQHREYVRECISATSLLNVPRNRTLDDFFGQATTRRFREGLADLKIEVGALGEDINIHLRDFSSGFQSLTEGLVKMLNILINDGEGVSRNLRTPREDAFKYRHDYLRSQFGDIHAALFALADQYPYVWLKGKDDYGIRIAHHRYGSGVSLIRSVGESGFLIKGRR